MNSNEKVIVQLASLKETFKNEVGDKCERTSQTGDEMADLASWAIKHAEEDNKIKVACFLSHIEGCCIDKDLQKRVRNIRDEYSIKL